jgi:hypothetical protein
MINSRPVGVITLLNLSEAGICGGFVNTGLSSMVQPVRFFRLGLIKGLVVLMT